MIHAACSLLPWVACAHRTLGRVVFSCVYSGANMVGMAKYYLYILCSRHHRHLSVGVTPDLAVGISRHRLFVNRRLRKKRVLQKLVYVESLRSIEDAVTREVQLKSAPRQRIVSLVESVNPGWDSISLSELIARGY